MAQPGPLGSQIAASENSSNYGTTHTDPVDHLARPPARSAWNRGSPLDLLARASIIQRRDRIAPSVSQHDDDWDDPIHTDRWEMIRERIENWREDRRLAEDQLRPAGTSETGLISNR